MQLTHEQEQELARAAEEFCALEATCQMGGEDE